MSLRSKALIALLAATWLAASGFAQAQTTFRVSTYAPFQHPVVSVALVNWAKEVEKETGGRVKINILQAALGQPQAHFDMAVDGISDITLGVPGYNPGRFSLVEVAGMPNVGNSAEGLSVALWRTYTKYPELQKEFAQVKILGLFTTSPMHFFNAKRPINTFEDFAGLKVRVAGGMMSDVAKTLNITPVLQPAGKVYELMSSGVIDGYIFPPETVKSFKLEKLTKYVTIIPGGLTAVPIFLAMNKAKFDALSKDDQDGLMRASGEKLSHLNGVVWDERDREGLEALKAEGVQIATTNAELTKKIFDGSQGAVDVWLTDVKKKGIEGSEILAYFRGEVKKVEKR
jgi:TRAP-type C4-dicarboxylate transport system substrate-binding protein